jgi:hypothetical protein
MSNVERQVARELAKAEKREKENRPPEAIEAADYWQWQASLNAVERLRQELRGTQAELQLVEQECKRLTGVVTSKYRFDPQRGDRVDTKTMAIHRAPRGEIPGGGLNEVIEDAVADATEASEVLAKASPPPNGAGASKSGHVSRGA